MFYIENNNHIQIKDIQVGDTIKDNIVLGKIHIKNSTAEIFNYNDVNVTGNHLVFDDHELLLYPTFFQTNHHLSKYFFSPYI